MTRDTSDTTAPADLESSEVAMDPSTERLLVTGGASGIGLAITEAGIRRGWDVVVLDRAPAPAGRSIQVDLADPDATSACLANELARGPITRLVNNVGAVFPNSLEHQTLEEIDAAYALNVRCAIVCTQAVIPGMRQAGFGRVVNISSRAALGKELRTAYSASKAALLGLTRTWALELAGDGVTVNAIGPGPISTDLFVAANPANSPRTRAIVEGIPVRRLGTADDVAHATEFFLDERSGFVTGQVLYVCGGLTVGLSSL